MDCSAPGFPVCHYLPEFAQTHARWIGDTNQPSHPLSSPSLPAFNLSQHQGLFQRVGSLHQVAKVLELQLQQYFDTFLWQTSLNLFFKILLTFNIINFLQGSHLLYLYRQSSLISFVSLLNHCLVSLFKSVSSSTVGWKTWITWLGCKTVPHMHRYPTNIHWMNEWEIWVEEES